jgi:CBS domain-containing protein
MRTEMVFVPAERPIGDVWDEAQRSAAPAYLIGTPERLVGSVSHEQLSAATTAGRGQEPIAAVVDDRGVHVHADQPVDIVLDRFADTAGLLPVVSRADVRRVEGVITLDSITRFVGRRAARPE